MFCYLFAGTEEAAWAEEAYTHVAEMTKGAIVYTQISNYTEDGIPLVYCYVVVGPQVSISSSTLKFFDIFIFRLW